jgi:hypothetical protein
LFSMFVLLSFCAFSLSPLRILLFYSLSLIFVVFVYCFFSSFCPFLSSHHTSPFFRHSILSAFPRRQHAVRHIRNAYPMAPANTRLDRMSRFGE